jgi:translation elongation factor EF-4
MLILVGLLYQAMAKLTLNDASVSMARETSNALGQGFRCGFLGLLHMDVFRQVSSCKLCVMHVMHIVHNAAMCIST